MASLSFDIDANTAPAQQGVASLGDKIDTLIGQMIDLVDAGRKAGDSTEDIADNLSRLTGAKVKDTTQFIHDYERALESTGDAGRDASRETEQGLERVSEQARRTSGDVAGIGTDGPDSLRKLGRSGEEIGQELRQNLGQTFAQFKGDLRDLPQIAQDTLGGLAASGALGGIPGLIATTVGAAGLGLLIGAFQQTGEKSDEVKAKAADLASAYIAASGRAAPAVKDIVETLNELATATDGVTLQNLSDVADRSNNSFRDLAQAYAGNTDNLNNMLAAGREYLTQLEAQRVQGTGIADSDLQAGFAISAKIVAQRQYVDYLTQASDAANTARDTEALWLQAGGQLMQDRADRVQQLANAYDNATGSASDYFKTEEDGTTTFDWGAYLGGAEIAIAHADEFKRRILSVPEEIRAEAEGIFADQGAVAANSYLDAYVNASAADQARFSNVARSNGEAAGTAFAEGMAGKIPREFHSVVKLDVDDSRIRQYEAPTKYGTVSYRAANSRMTAWDG